MPIELYNEQGQRLIDQYNFFLDTECIWYFLEADEYAHVLERYPSYISPHGSSTYWYDADGVYRLSNHWGQGIRSCNWFLDAFEEDIQERTDSLEFYHAYGDEYLGFARWCDFIDIRE